MTNATCALSLALCFCAAPALAGPPPCEPQWTPGFVRDGAERSVDSMAVFDLDGTGPQPLRLIIAGSPVISGVQSPTSVFTWDGRVFEPMLGAAVTGLCAIDPDEDGPAGVELLASRTSPAGIVRWSGGWQAFAPFPATNYPVTQWTTCDFDGSGPNPAQLVVVCRSQVFTRTPANTWSPLASTTFSTSSRLVSVDLDGTGPDLPRLYISTNSGLLRWNGSAWAQTLSGTVYDVAVADLDGPGPGGQEVVVTGSLLRTATGAFASTVHLGAQGGWLPMPQPSGSLSEGRLQVIAGRLFYGSASAINGGIRLFNGSTWDLLSPSPTDIASRAVSQLISFDPDGAGGEPARLILRGDFRSSTTQTRNLSIITPGGWKPLSTLSAVPFSLFDLTSFDPDGPGPLPARLYALGTLPGTSTSQPDVLRWETDHWSPIATSHLANSTNGIGLISRLLVYSADGIAPARLCALGWFDAINDTPAIGLATFDGDSWFAGPPCPLVSPNCINLIDLDGPGGQRERILFAGVAANGGNPGVALFNGSAWTQLPGTPPTDVLGIFAVKPDNDNPPDLIALGRLGPLYRFTGSGWTTVSSTFFSSSGGYLRDAEMFDDDGPGGHPPRLYIGGPFDTLGNIPAPSGFARYDGSDWTPLPLADFSRVDSITIADLDGDGPDPQSLLLGGDFYSTGSLPASFHCFLPYTTAPGTQFGGSMATGPLDSVCVFTEPGAERPSIFASGSFYSMGRILSSATPGVVSQGFARYGCAPCIAFPSQPSGGEFTAGHPFSLSASEQLTDQTPPLPLTFRWRKDGLPLADGNGLSGAATRTLSFASLHAADSGRYDVLVTADCGSAASAPATLAVTCPADRDASGTVDVGDLFSFITSYFYATDLAADFNRDFSTSIQDLLDFIQAYFDGC